MPLLPNSEAVEVVTNALWNYRSPEDDGHAFMTQIDAIHAAKKVVEALAGTGMFVQTFVQCEGCHELIPIAEGTRPVEIGFLCTPSECGCGVDLGELSAVD